MSISWAGMFPDITDSRPIKPLTSTEQKRVSQTTSDILQSFRFHSKRKWSALMSDKYPAV